MVARRRLPPVDQIEAFLQAARAPNFRTAAEQLALSPAALTRRIQAFSDYVGEELFERSGGGMRLTQAGHRCIQQLEPVFFSLRDAAASVGGRDQTIHQINISVSHSLAVSWLIPRMQRFRESHPMIDLTLKIERTSARVRSGDADIGICYAGVDCSRLRMEPLFGVTVTPVACPAVAARNSGRVQLSDECLLVSAQSSELWRWWGRETGYPEELAASTEFDILQGMYEAAACGLGIALGASPTVWPYMDSGKLVPLGMGSAHIPDAYRLISTDARIAQPQVAAVWDWLLHEARTVCDPGCAAPMASPGGSQFDPNIARRESARR